MPWVNPSPRVLGEMIDEDIWNQDVVDNSQFLYNNHETPHSVSVYQTGNIALTNSAYTTITWNSELWDTSSMHSTVSNTERLVAPVNGLYLVTMAMRGTFEFFIELMRGSSTQLHKWSETTDGSSRGSASGAVLVNLNASEYVWFRGRLYSAGGTQNLIGGQIELWAQMQRMAGKRT